MSRFLALVDIMYILVGTIDADITDVAPPAARRNRAVGHFGIEERAALDPSTAISEAASAFGSRLRCAALVGSLAHGGFTALASDVDIALVLDLARTATAPHRTLGIAPSSEKGSVRRALSIFEGTVDQINGVAPGGGFHVADRLDLIDATRYPPGTTSARPFGPQWQPTYWSQHPS